MQDLSVQTEIHRRRRQTLGCVRVTFLQHRLPLFLLFFASFSGERRRFCIPSCGRRKGTGARRHVGLEYDAARPTGDRRGAASFVAGRRSPLASWRASSRGKRGDKQAEAARAVERPSSTRGACPSAPPLAPSDKRQRANIEGLSLSVCHVFAAPTLRNRHRFLLKAGARRRRGKVTGGGGEFVKTKGGGWRLNTRTMGGPK